MNVPKKYLFRFYNRGYNYDPRYDYIPDFKSTLEKESWEAGLKKKYYRNKSMKKKNPLKKELFKAPKQYSYSVNPELNYYYNCGIDTAISNTPAPISMRTASHYKAYEAGVKKGKSVMTKKKNPCGTKRKNPKRKLTDANGYLYMARYQYIHKGVKSKDLQTLYIVAFNVTEAYAKFEKYMNKWKKDIYLHYVEPKGFRVPVIT